MANVYMGLDVEDFIFGEATYEEACKKEGCKKEGCKKEEYDEEIQQEMDATGVRECVDEPEVACYRIALENEQNYNMIMNAFMMKEFSVLESTGHEMVYEAADGKNFLDTIKSLILKFWEKMKGVFKAVTQKIQTTLISNKGFIKKYEGQTFVTPTDEFQGYKFPNVKDDSMYVDISNLVPGSESTFATAEKAKSFLDNYDLEKIKANMRSAACGDINGSVESGDFTKKLKMHLYGSEKKEAVKLPAFADLIKELKDAKDTKKKLKDSYKGIDKAVRDDLAKVKTAKKAIEKKDEDRNMKMKAAKAVSDSISASLTIMSTTYSHHTKAMMAYLMQCRAQAAFYVTHQPAKNESAAFMDELGIQLI